MKISIFSLVSGAEMEELLVRLRRGAEAIIEAGVELCSRPGLRYMEPLTLATKPLLLY